MNSKEIKIQKAIEKAEELKFEKDGSSIINVGLKSKDDFFSPYSYKEYKTLNLRMLQYIENEAQEIPTSKKLSLHIYTESKTSSNQKKQMREAISRQFAEEFVSIKRALRKNLIQVVLLMLIGIAILTLAVYLEEWKLSGILSNTVMIIAWVFEWESAEFLIFKRTELVRRQKLIRRFLECETHFLSH